MHTISWWHPKTIFISNTKIRKYNSQFNSAFKSMLILLSLWPSPLIFSSRSTLCKSPVYKAQRHVDCRVDLHLFSKQHLWLAIKVMTSLLLTNHKCCLENKWRSTLHVVVPYRAVVATYKKWQQRYYVDIASNLVGKTFLLILLNRAFLETSSMISLTSQLSQWRFS